MSSQGEAWAQIVSTTDFDSDAIQIAKDEFVIGRAQACDLSLSGNKLVSGRHCKIIRDPETKQVWLEDGSTNGTYVNMKIKVSKGQRLKINHGDEIHVVLFKDQEEKNVAYLFQDLAVLERESLEETVEYSGDDRSSDDPTQEYEIMEDVEDIVTVKRPLAQDDDHSSGPATKKTKQDTAEESAADVAAMETKDSEVLNAPAESTSEEEKVKETKSDEEKAVPGQEKEWDLEKESAAAERKAREIEAEWKEGQESEGHAGVCKKSGDGISGDYGKDIERDEMEEALLCGICQDMLHDCISLQPCMHSFCSSCYSPWMEKSNECPSCRNQVMRLSRNHIVNNLVEAYLKEHPEKRRSEEEIRELNAKNKITDDMVQPRLRRRNLDDYDDGDYGDDDDDDDDEDDDDDQVELPATGFGARIIEAVGGLFGLGVARPPPTICRQCPGNVAETTATAAATATAATESAASRSDDAGPTGANASTSTAASPGRAAAPDQKPSTSTDAAERDAEPSTSTGLTGTGPPPSATNTRTTPDGEIVKMPDPPDYTCGQGEVHLMCLCCKQAMPDRRTAAVTDPDIPPQQCDICYRGYCHMYWGCKRVDCYGCLNHFRDMNFGKKSLTSVINDNPYESEIFRNYMEDKNLSVKDVLRECLVRLDRGEYVSTDAHNFRGRKGSDVRICYPCGLRNFKELAYQFRRDIPRSELPGQIVTGERTAGHREAGHTMQDVSTIFVIKPDSEEGGDTKGVSCVVRM